MYIKLIFMIINHSELMQCSWMAHLSVAKTRHVRNRQIVRQTDRDYQMEMEKAINQNRPYNRKIFIQTHRTIRTQENISLFLHWFRFLCCFFCSIFFSLQFKFNSDSAFVIPCAHKYLRYSKKSVEWKMSWGKNCLCWEILI